MTSAITLARFFDHTGEENLARCEIIDGQVFGAGDAWTRDNFLKILPGKAALSSVVLEKDDIVGYAIAYLARPQLGHLSRIAVLPARQGRGIGRALMAHLWSLAQRLGLQGVTLEFDERLGVAAFYESLGYAQVQGEDLARYLDLKDKRAAEHLYLSGPRKVYLRGAERGVTPTDILRV